MLLLAHVAAGALIGQQLGGSPPVIFGLGFASHFLLDLVPHGDRSHVEDYYHKKKANLKKIYSFLLADSAASIILVAALMTMPTLHRADVAWGIAGSVFPDFLVGLNEVFSSSILKAFMKFHFLVHNALIHKIRVPKIQGVLLQLLLIAGLLAAL